MEKDKVPIWYLHIPDQLIWLGVALVLSPPIYSVYLFKYHIIGLAIIIFFVWLPPYVWFLSYLHRRGSARLPFTVIFSVFIIMLGSSAVYFYL
jgi:hypothetical protein